MNVRPANASDSAQIAGIYNHYIATSHATFEFEPVDAVEMGRRMNAILSGGYPFLVCEDTGEIVGYANGHPFRERPAYRHSVEISVYIKHGHEGNGVGSLLYERLFAEIGGGVFHVVIAGISLPNDASVHLHEKFGLKKTAHFREVGRKFGRWIDVGYWQKILP